MPDAEVAAIDIRPHIGSRQALLPFYRMADESDLHIRSYCDIGDVLLAVDAGTVVGMAQLYVEGATIEIVSLAVMPERRRRGVASLLIDVAARRCRSVAARRLVVCTGVWEIDNIVFYLRRGFRIFHVARDFFSADKGYDLAVRDQIQLEMHV